MVRFFQLIRRSLVGNRIVPQFEAFMREAVCLVDFRAESEWGFYGFRIESSEFSDEDAADRKLAEIQKGVPANLQALLYSGYAYPPALALLRDEVWVRSISTEAFFAEGERILERILRRSASDRFFLARMVESKSLGQGQFFWIVRYDLAKDRVDYVNEDFALLNCPRSNFDVRVEQCQVLTGLASIAD